VSGATGALSSTGSTLEPEATTRRLERGETPVEGLRRLGNPSGWVPAAATARGAEKEATGRGLGAAALAMPPRRAHGGVTACVECRAQSVGVGRFAAWAKRDGRRREGCGRRDFMGLGPSSIACAVVGPLPGKSS